MGGMKARLRAGETLAGVVNIIPSPVATQALAAAGADWVVIDQEHGPIGPEAMHAMIASTGGTNCAPLVRVSRRDEGYVKGALDAGAEGIVFPLVTSADNAAECVAMTQYPPKGRRGWGPFVAHSRWGVPLFDYYAERGGEAVCILLIETRSAVAHIREICKVEGVDGMIIAPFDLSTDLGVSGRMDAPELREAMTEAERVILEAGIPLGGAAMTKEQTQEILTKGYRLPVHQFDVLILKQFVQQAAEWRRR
jgi:4-hydroxy-2-oxoheptanedioate aldolase